ncbi:MAG: hypothetical protein ABL986_03095 [Vicinamibacterales bacterium]
MRTIHWLFGVGALLFVFGIGFVVVGARAAREAPAPAASTPLAPVASVKQIMNGIVVPASTRVYDSVSTTVTEKGVEEIVPKDDQEWTAVGDSAAALAEAGNLLMMDGRAVDRGEWITITQAMIAASQATLAAVDAKSPEAVLKAGSDLNTTCDNCHMRYQR